MYVYIRVEWNQRFLTSPQFLKDNGRNLGKLFKINGFWCGRYQNINEDSPKTLDSFPRVFEIIPK